MSADSPYYMPPSSYRRETADDMDKQGVTPSVSHPAVKRESTWRPGQTNVSRSSASSSSRPTNAWASRDSPRSSSPGPSQGATSSRSRNNTYYEPPDTSSSSRSNDRGSDRRSDSRTRDRGRDRDVGKDDGWRRRDRDNDRGTWDDYRRRMDSSKRRSPDRDRDGGRESGWGRKRKDDAERKRGRTDDRARGDKWGDRWRDDSRARSPDDDRRRTRSLSRSRSRSRSRDRSPPRRRDRRSSLSDSDSDSDRDQRRSPRWRPPTPDGKRRAPSPSLPKAKRARDYSPPRRRSPSRGRSTSRSVTPPRRRASSSPRSTNGRADRGRSPESPRTLSSQPAARSRTGGSYQERDQSDRGSQESSQSRNRPDPRQNRDRWQPVPPRGPRDSQPFGRQTVAPTNNPPFSQTADGPVKMRKWGAAANSRSPSPVASLPNVLQRPGTSPAQAAHSASQPQPPRGPAAQEAAVPPGFKRPPPTGPRRADPPTGPANGNGNTSPSKSNSAWRPIQQAPATDAFKQAITGGPVGRQVSSQSVTSEARATDSTDVRNTPRPVLSPRRSDKWSPDKWSPSKGNASLRSAAYLDRLADKERQYDQHLSTVAPYVTAAFTQWYSQNATPALTDFLVHYFGRRPSPSELDQIQHLLQRRTQLSHDQQELRNLHEQALRLESRPPPPHTSKGLPYDDPDPRPVSTSPQRRTAVHPAKQVAPSRQRAGPGEAYERLSQVGEGTYGKVYKARSTTSGVLVALKRIRMEQEKDGFPITSMREIKLLQALNHPNVLQLQEMMVSKGSVYMVLEYMNHDLTGILSHPEVVLSAANIKSLNHQMLAGLGYLHRRGILHRDMKGSNILLNGAGELKLADFGLARFYHKRKRGDYTNRVITLWYRSPELLMGETCYGPEVDTWSAGCIMLEIFTTKPVFQGSDEINQLEVIYSVMGTPDESSWPGITELPWYELVRPKDVVPPRFRSSFSKWLSPAALDLVEGLLKFNPAERLLADDALEMPYFKTEDPPMERPTQLAKCGDHHEMSVKLERHRRREAK